VKRSGNEEITKKIYAKTVLETLLVAESYKATRTRERSDLTTTTKVKCKGTELRNLIIHRPLNDGVAHSSGKL